MLEEKKKLSWNIERTNVDMDVPTRCHYVYKFTITQWLESIDDYSPIGIDHDVVKQIVIDNLVDEFRFSLNNIVYGNPALDRKYKIQNIKKKMKNKILQKIFKG